MKTIVTAFLALLFHTGACCFADLTIANPKWMQSGITGKKATVKQIEVQKDFKIPKILISADITNNFKENAEAIILKYAISFHVKDSDSEDGIWTVPVWLDEVRIAIIKPGQTKNIDIPNIKIAEFLKRFRAAGLSPDKIKADLMIEPHKNDKIKNNFTTVTLNLKYN